MNFDYRTKPLVRLIGLISLTMLAIGTMLAEAEPSAQSTRSTAGVPAYRQADKVAVFTVHGVIDQVTLRSLERRFEQAKRDGATAVVLDIDTPGGRVDSTLDICHLLKTDAPANTVAWINPQAFSAGTFIALATREIVVAPNSRFGDAAPIMVSPFGGLMELPAAERAKLESPLLDEVIDSARRNRHDERLVQAFVSVGMELWLIEHRETGERLIVNRSEYNTVFGEDPPAQFTPASIEGDRADPQRVRPYVDESIPRTDDDAGDAASERRQLMRDFRAQRPDVRSALSEDDRGKYRLLRQVIADDQLLTVRPAEAMHYGLAMRVIRDDEQLMDYFGANEIVRYDQNWSETLAWFLMLLPVRAVLIIIFLVCLFLELAAPGTGMFGTGALLALLLLLGAPMLMGMAQWWGIVFVLAGLVLLAIEIFVLTGVGVAGVVGLLCLATGLVGTFLTGDISGSQGQMNLWSSVITTMTALFGAGIAIWIISRQFHSVPLLNRLILSAELRDRDEPTPRTEILPEPSDVVEAESGSGADAATYEEYPPVGAVGEASTPLYPHGRAMFNNRIYDVQSIDGYVEKGTPVRVVRVGRFVVEVEVADE